MTTQGTNFMYGLFVKINDMSIAEQIRLKLQLKETSEVEYKSAAGGFPKAEFW